LGGGVADTDNADASVHGVLSGTLDPLRFWKVILSAWGLNVSPKPLRGQVRLVEWLIS
jgi:hypothetical protein